MVSESRSEIRSRQELHCAFLEAVSSGPVIQQRIMENARIKNNEQFKSLKDELLAFGWIKVVGEDQYEITRKGVPVLEHLKHTREIYAQKGS